MQRLLEHVCEGGAPAPEPRRSGQTRRLEAKAHELGRSADERGARTADEHRRAGDRVVRPRAEGLNRNLHLRSRRRGELNREREGGLAEFRDNLLVDSDAAPSFAV